MKHDRARQRRRRSLDELDASDWFTIAACCAVLALLTAVSSIASRSACGDLDAVSAVADETHARMQAQPE